MKGDHTHARHLTKGELAEHVRQPHEGTDDRMRYLAHETTELMQWSRDELVREHALLHGDGEQPDHEAAGSHL